MATLDGELAGSSVDYDSSFTHPMLSGEAATYGADSVVATPSTITQSPASTVSIGKNTPVDIEIIDTTPIRRVIIHAAYEGKTLLEVVHDGSNFSPNYSNNSNNRDTITGGYVFTLLRDGGWPGSPSFTVYVFDTNGEVS